MANMALACAVLAVIASLSTVRADVGFGQERYARAVADKSQNTIIIQLTSSCPYALLSDSTTTHHLPLPHTVDVQVLFRTPKRTNFHTHICGRPASPANRAVHLRHKAL